MTNLKLKITGFAPTFSTRFNFTYHFLVSAATLANLARDIDNKGEQATEDDKIKHLGYVCGSIMQSVAALEAEIWTIYNYGIGHHLGSNGIDNVSSNILKTISGDIDKISIITKFNLALKLGRQKEFDLGRQAMQDTSILISLRNEITHYKSLQTQDLEQKKLFKILKTKDSKPPSFFSGFKHNFFPLECLTFRRAKWATKTAVKFIEYFYSELGIKSPLAGRDINF